MNQKTILMVLRKMYGSEVTNECLVIQYLITQIKLMI